MLKLLVVEHVYGKLADSALWQHYAAVLIDTSFNDFYLFSQSWESLKLVTTETCLILLNFIYLNLLFFQNIHCYFWCMCVCMNITGSFVRNIICDYFNKECTYYFLILFLFPDTHTSIWHWGSLCHSPIFCCF